MRFIKWLRKGIFTMVATLLVLALIKILEMDELKDDYSLGCMGLIVVAAVVYIVCVIF